MWYNVAMGDKKKEKIPLTPEEKIRRALKVAKALKIVFIGVNIIYILGIVAILIIALATGYGVDPTSLILIFVSLGVMLLLDIVMFFFVFPMLKKAVERYGFK